MKTGLVILFCLFNGILMAQNSTYNVYEIGKGEIFKKDYRYLLSINDKFLAATIIKEETDYLYADLTGIIDLKENVFLPFEYRNIEKIRDNYNLYKKENPLLVAVSNGKSRALYKFEDNTFKELTDFKYFKFRPFLFDGNFLTCSDNQILNLNNGKIIKTAFLEIKPLTNNLAATKDKNYKWGIIDKTGTVILNNDFSEIRNYDIPLISIEKRDSVGVVNNNGQIIIPPVFYNIKYTENLILAGTFNNGEKFKINKKLKEKLSNWNTTITKNNKNTPKIYSLNNLKFKQIGLYGAFSQDGKLIIPFEYNLLEKGIDTEVIVYKDNKVGIFSENGKKIANIKYDAIKVALNTFYIVEENNKYGILTKNGKQLLETKYKNVFPISETEILYLENNFWYKISYNKKLSEYETQKTELTSNYTFQYFREHSNNQKNYYIAKKHGKYGVIDNQLNFLIACINPEANGYINNKYFDLGTIYTSKGKPLPKNIKVSDSYNKYPIICMKNDKFGAYNENGFEVIPFIYTEVQHIDGKRFIVSKQGKPVDIRNFIETIKEVIPEKK